MTDISLPFCVKNIIEDMRVFRPTEPVVKKEKMDVSFCADVHIIVVNSRLINRAGHLEGPGSIILADIVTDNRSHVPNTD
jgi:hypothetical protein